MRWPPQIAASHQVGNLGGAGVEKVGLRRGFQAVAQSLDFVRPPRQLSQSDGMRRPVSGRDAVYAPKLSTCSKHR